jgi:hypothetical protein
MSQRIEVKAWPRADYWLASLVLKSNTPIDRKLRMPQTWVWIRVRVDKDAGEKLGYQRKAFNRDRRFILLTWITESMNQVLFALSSPFFYYAPTPERGAGASCLLSYTVTFTTSNPALALLSNIWTVSPDLTSSICFFTSCGVLTGLRFFGPSSLCLT